MRDRIKIVLINFSLIFGFPTLATCQNISLLERIKINGFSGVATDKAETWPFEVTGIVVHDNGEFEGNLEWPTLNAIHKIEGVVAGRIFSFRETEFIKEGTAVIGCRYTLDTSEVFEGSINGTYQCASPTPGGVVSVFYPEAVSQQSNGRAPRERAPLPNTSPPD